jgi:hypothetical protein
MAQVVAMVAGRRHAWAWAARDRVAVAADAGSVGWVMRLGLVVNGPAGHGNSEKLYFRRPIRVSVAR